MGDDRRGCHRIQKGTGRAKCQYCNETITTEELEVVVPVRSKYDRHFHLHSSGQCKGWIYNNWDFIKSLLWQLADVGGDDYNDVVNMIIEIWEKEP